MAVFNYAVRDKSGKVTKGQLEGDTKEAVRAKLTQMGYQVTSTNEAERDYLEYEVV